MKRIIYYILTMTAVCTWSCNDFLDKEPVQDYEYQFVLDTQEGLDLLLNGTYSLISGRYYYGSLIYLFEVAKGPDFFVRNVSGGSSYYYEARFNTTSTTNGQARYAWQNIYNVIRNTVLILENIDNVGGDIETIRRIKGEALAINGLAYFDLMRLFAYPPIFSINDPSIPGGLYRGPDNGPVDPLNPTPEELKEYRGWGVPIISTSDMSINPQKYVITRGKAEDTYAHIVKQLRHAKTLLEGRASRKGYIDDATVSALLMRAYLYLRWWDDVITEGEEWMGKYGGNYSMIPYESYTTNYYKPYNSENIWELDYSTHENLGSNSINYWVRKQTYDDPGNIHDGEVKKDVGYSKLGLTYNHYTNGLPNLQADPDDIRNYLICDMGIINHPEYKTIRKYIGDPFHGIHNVPIVRLPEIYLTLAEAYANTGNEILAGEFCSKVSQARRKKNGGGQLANIYAERRLEFLLEGHTYWDYFRTARDITNRHVIESIANGRVRFTDYNFDAPTSSYSHRVVYPIPLLELNANPAMRNQQNGGYAKWVRATEE